jgi:hypothetical protein
MVQLRSMLSLMRDKAPRKHTKERVRMESVSIRLKPSELTAYRVAAETQQEPLAILLRRLMRAGAKSLIGDRPQGGIDCSSPSQIGAG